MSWLTSRLQQSRQHDGFAGTGNSDSLSVERDSKAGPTGVLTELSILLTSLRMDARMVPRWSTSGVMSSLMPYGLNWTLTPSRVATEYGISPPARKLALEPLRVDSCGSAKSVALPC